MDGIGSVGTGASEGVGGDLRARLQGALGPAYALERELGGGGMARVFVARDEALGREIVVKVLPPDAAAAVSAERFKREIALAAGLQHPHIVPVLGAGETANGLPYYTMPFVAGESLRQRLAREGELPVAEIAAVLKDVARALAYAHGRGVVHRDVKPDNVLLSGGAAVVTDFGVAKALSASATSGSGTPLTQLGTVLGTPAYAAPEQAAGDAVDHRADLYALGVVAYEMLAGRPPFDHRGAQRLLAAHATETPEPILRRRPATPAPLATLVTRLLEKSPADRPQSADDVLRALDAITPVQTPGGIPAAGGAVMPVSAAPGPARVGWTARVLRLAPWVLSAALALALSLLLLTRPAAPLPRPLVTAVTAPEGQEFVRGPHFALSPNGSRLAFAAIGRDGRRLLWLRRLDGRVAAALAGTDGAAWPFWSPDGQQLGFFAGGRLRTIDAEGGPTRDLCPAPAPSGGSWGTRGVILYASLAGAGIHRVRAGGGPCTPLTRVEPEHAAHKRPDFLPDGRHFLFHSQPSRILFAGDAETGAYHALRTNATNALFAWPHYVLFTDPVTPQPIYAQRLDLRARRLTGEPTRVVDTMYMSYGDLGASTSRDGLLVLAHVGTFVSKRLVWVDHRGAVLDTLQHRYHGSAFGLSRDGRRVAFTGRDVWIHDLVRRVAVKADAQPGTGRPSWGPGDSLVAYTTTASAGPPSVRVYRPSRGTSDTLFTLPDRPLERVDWSPDGRYLSVVRQPGAGAARSEVWLYSLAARRARPLLASPGANYDDARFAPDGRWVAYTSDETGASEVYLRRLDREAAPVRVSAAGGTQPVWRADGHELFFSTGDQRVFVVPVRLGERAEVGTPRVVVASPPDRLGFTMFQVTPDGARVVLFQQKLPSDLTVLQGWQTALGARRGTP